MANNKPNNTIIVAIVIGVIPIAKLEGFFKTLLIYIYYSKDAIPHVESLRGEQHQCNSDDSDGDTEVIRLVKPLNHGGCGIKSIFPGH